MIHEKVAGFEGEFKLGFRDKMLLQGALDHRVPALKKRYALAGDALLDFILFDWLMGEEYSQGKMDCIRQKLNTDGSLAGIGREMGLGDYVIFPDSADEGDRARGDAYYNDTLEALVYVIMKDYGLGRASEFVEEHILSRIPVDEYGCE